MSNINDIIKMGNAVTLAVAKASQAQQPQQPQNNGNMLDSANQPPKDQGENLPDVVYTDTMRRDTTYVIKEWSETTTEDLGEGEGLGDRLLALVVGTAADSETDLTEDEAEYAGMVAELLGDYLIGKGIAEDDVQALVYSGDFDNAVADRVHEALLDKLPQGEDAMLDDADNFVDGDEDKMLDATYRKVIAVRGGKKVKLNKRIAGTIRLNAAQKAAVRKMQRKAFSGGAKMRRAKSMRVRKKMGL